MVALAAYLLLVMKLPSRLPWMWVLHLWSGNALLLAALLSSSQAGHAESILDDYTIRHWNVEDGLPEAQVLSVRQMPDGYLWLTTPHHLVRFDGVSFTALPRDGWPTNLTGELRQFRLDREGTQWICGSEGLLRFDGRVWQQVPLKNDTNATSARIVTRQTPDGAMQALWKREFYCLGLDTNGTVQAVSNEGVYQFDGRQMVLIPMSADGTNQLEITAAAMGGQGECWLVVGGKLLQFQGGKFIPEPFTPELQPHDFYKVVLAAEDVLWVQQLDGRLFRRKGMQWAEILPAGLRISSIVETAVGDTIWIGSAEGLHRLKNGVSQTTTGAANDVPSDTRCLTLSREGGLWVGTSWGLYRLQPRSVRLFPVNPNSVRSGVSAVWPVTASKFWVGASDLGVLFGEAGGLHAKDLNPVLNKTKVSAFLKTADGKLWVGTHGGHLWYQQDDGGFHQNRQLEGVASRNITCLLEYTNGQVWVGSREGLLRGDVNSYLVMVDKRPAVILAICRGLDDTVWAGTQGDGLWKLAGGKVVREYHMPDGLPSEIVRFLHCDEAGVLWIGTPAGVACWSDSKKTIFRAEQGLPDEDIRQMLDDQNGHLWLGIQRGLLRVDKSEFAEVVAGHKSRISSFLLLGPDDGLTAELNSGDSYPLSVRGLDGRLWFCTQDGLAMVNPSQLRDPIQLGNLEVAEIRADDNFTVYLRPFLPGRALPATELPDRHFTLPPGSARVKLSFTMPALVVPEQVRFQAWLEGHQAGWMPAFAERSVTYPPLPPGEYRFHLKATAGDGVWRELNEPVKFTIAAFFYETVWFKTVLFMLGLASSGLAAGMLVRQRAKKKILNLKREKTRELAVETERSRIARDIHDNLGATLTQIAMLSESAQTESSLEKQLKPRLADIFSRARSATRELDEIVWAIDPGKDTLENLVGYLCQFASDYLRLAGLSFRMEAPEELPEKFLGSPQRHHLFLATRETLHNVVKHAHATEVWLRVKFENDTLEIIIEDNGTGAGKAPAASGHGTGNIINRMQQLGGTVNRRAGSAGGTLVEFILPLAASTKKHESKL